jgi:hypothetical protein
MNQQHAFKWRHFEAEIMLLCVRWYLRYALSYRDLEELMLERGLQVDHTTIYRWGKPLRPGIGKALSAAALQPAMIPGKWTRRTSKSETPGCISTEPSIQMGTRWSFS